MTCILQDVFKPRIVNKSLHKISSHNGVRVVHFAISKKLTFSAHLILID
jgi:hypothetical protein